jgi:sugar phosphate isomerase/epimerase
MRTASTDERARGMAAGGMRETSIFPLDLRNMLDAGDSIANIRARLDRKGARISVLDPFSQWLPGWERPAELSDADFEFYGFGEAEFFRMAEGLGVDSMTVIEPYGREVPAEFGAEAFAAVCDRAAELGMRVHLEFIPFTGIPDLARGWEIVRLADRSNGGLVFDVWHYFLGNPDEGLLRTIPGEKVFVVQVSDAAAGARGTIEDLYRRLTPGEGVFDLGGVLRTLDEIGGLTSVGPEIFSDEYDAMRPEEAGRRSAQSVRAVLEQAGVGGGGSDAAANAARTRKETAR